MSDFTLKIYHDFLQRLSSLPCATFATFAAFVQDSSPFGIAFRHDVDRRPENSLAFARLQSELEIRATYYFRIVPESFEPGIIEQIAELGHEVGYHYEDLSLAAEAMRKERRKKGAGRKEKGEGKKENGIRRPEK